ncbi:hypothetical protein E4T43_05581 [Aureobasidium subglaciale]|nr:hypothetical protein E4T43_05581 [Aureobasidium subglaciale]
MTDFLSALPAPLPLYILLDLPDLKALYAAILASPHLYAVFNLNAQLIFRTIIFRSLPDELASPVLIYMSLRERLATRNHSDNLTPEILQAMIDDFVVAGKTTPWPRAGSSDSRYCILNSSLQARLFKSEHRKRLSTFEMLRLNSSLARIRIKTDRRPDGPMFGTNARIFENFGFGFWYEERLIDELWLNCRGYRVGDPQPKIDWNNLPHNYCTASDEHFRPLKLYQQQVEREQQGWHR